MPVECPGPGVVVVYVIEEGCGGGGGGRGATPALTGRLFGATEVGGGGRVVFH